MERIEIPFLPERVRVLAHVEPRELDSEVDARLKPLREALEQRHEQQRQAMLAEIAALKQAAAALTQAAQNLTSATEETRQQASELALRLALQIARRLVQIQLRRHPDALIERVQAGLQERGMAAKPVEVRLHPETYRAIHAHFSADELARLAEAEVALVADEEVAPGAALARSEDGTLWLDPIQELEWLGEALWARLEEEVA